MRTEDDDQCGDCFCAPAWKFFYGSISKCGSCIVSDETCGEKRIFPVSTGESLTVRKSYVFFARIDEKIGFVKADFM